MQLSNGEKLTIMDNQNLSNLIYLPKAIQSNFYYKYKPESYLCFFFDNYHLYYNLFSNKRFVKDKHQIISNGNKPPKLTIPIKFKFNDESNN